MILECKKCEALVNAELIASYANEMNFLLNTVAQCRKCSRLFTDKRRIWCILSLSSS